MRVFRIIALFALAAALLFGVHATVNAVDMTLSQAQITAVQSDCQTIQSNLQQLQQSDRLLRGNLGQSYDTISQRLMAPLNSRIALNGLDGVQLAQTTVNFNNAFTQFRNDYTNYDDSLQSALAIKCSQNPAGEYSAIENARTARQTVSSDVGQLNALLVTYQGQLKDFEGSQLGVEGD